MGKYLHRSPNRTSLGLSSPFLLLSSHLLAWVLSAENRRSRSPPAPSVAVQRMPPPLSLRLDLGQILKSKKSTPRLPILPTFRKRRHSSLPSTTPRNLQRRRFLVRFSHFFCTHDLHLMDNLLQRSSEGSGSPRSTAISKRRRSLKGMGRFCISSSVRKSTCLFIIHRANFPSYRCTSPNAKPVTRVRWDTSTGNLQRHRTECNKKVAPAGKGINDFAHGSTYSKAKMRYLCALWVSRRHRPYTIVQDDELLDIFRMLYSQVSVPHPTTLSRDVREVYEMTRLEIAKKLQVSLHYYGPRIRIYVTNALNRLIRGDSMCALTVGPLQTSYRF